MWLPVILGLAASLWVGHWWGGVIVGLLSYVGSCYAHPEADCVWCGGKSKRRSEGGSVFHRCYVCHGSGSRRRVGTVALQSVGLMRRPG